MWFRKTKTEDKNYPSPGTERALDGHAAAYAVETMASDAIVVQSVPELAEVVEALKGLAPRGNGAASLRTPLVREETNLRSLAGLTTGYALSGLRASAMVSGLSPIYDSLQAAAGKRLPAVFHLTCRAPHEQAGALHGGHGDYFGAAAAGCFQLFAKNAQEVADFTLIAHRVAELSLTPGICAQDLFRTSHSVQNIRLPDTDLIRRYLGNPGDIIQAPTPAQGILLGAERRRIPVLVDRDRPVGTGGVQDEDSYFKAIAGQRPFFAGHLDEIIDLAMREFGELTGRFYAKASGYRADDAEYVVVAQGAVADELEAVVDYLRTSAKAKVGAVNLTALRPFPGPQLTQLLKGKKVVTVLERADEPLAEDLPLAREFRSAIDKAVENASDDGAQGWPSYETYQRPEDRPRVFSGIYGVGAEVPSFNELLAVFKNMLPGGGKRRFYVGVSFEQPTRRFPHLQTLQQTLNRGYPGLADLALPTVTDTPFAEHPGRTIQLYSLEIQSGVYASNLFAQALAGVFNGTVRTYPEGGLEPSLHANAVTIVYGERDLSLKSGPGATDTLLVSSDSFLEDLPSRAVIKKGGTLIVGSSRKPEKLWRSLSRRTAEWIQSHELKVFIIDPKKVASATASMPSFVDQLSIWAMFGAYLKTDPRLSADEVELFIGDFQGRLEQFLGRTHYLLTDLTKTMKRGTEEVAELPWRSWTVAEWPAVAEKDPPWTVQAADRSDGTVFDLTRFWHSVGYLYDTGESEQTLIDPFVATGIIPGASSAFRDMTPYRSRIPEWLPENCTGCGACWTFCPDTALPATIQSLPSIIGTAMSECKKAGIAMIQMERISEHLAKQAYRIISKGDRSKYLRAGKLLREAFDQLVGKMDLKKDQLEPMQSEFDQVCEVVEDFPVSRTALFFDDPNKKEKGSGALLSIALNPLSCKACGLCVEVCPDKALAWTEQTAEQLQSNRRNWDVLMTLPDAPGEMLDGFISPADPETQVYRMLDKTAYHSLVGGDGAFPGNGDKIAIHLASATIESVMKPRFEAHIRFLSDLIQRIEDKIQGKVKSAVEINDFDTFATQLGRLEGKGLTADKLTEIVGAEGERTIDEAQLKRLAALLGKLKAQRRLYMEGAGGVGRARMIMSIDAGGTTFWSGTYPDNPHPYPWVSHLPGDAPALAEGVFEGVARQLASEVAVCRRAELELEDAYDAEKHEPALNEFNWRSFNDSEWDLIPPVMVVGRPGTTRWEDVAKLLKSRYPIRVLMINNDAIAMGNAGTGDSEQAVLGSENNFGYLALSRGDVFVLQSSVGNPGHLMSGIAESLALRCPAFLHVYAPNPQTNGLASEKGAEDARLAYQSRAFPLFKASPMEQGAVVNIEGNPSSGQNWTEEQMTVRDPSGVSSSLVAPLTLADWAVREGRFQHHFEVIAKGHLNDNMKLITEYIELEPDTREGLQPYIHIVDDHGRHVVAIVSADLVRATESALEFWNVLQRAGTPGSAAPLDAVSGVAPRETEPVAAAVIDQSIHQQLTERLLWLSGYSRDPDFFKQSLREFVQRSRETSPGGSEG